MTREAAALISAAGSTQIRMSSSTLSLERIRELAVTLAETEWGRRCACELVLASPSLAQPC
jgi:hypothetical protein